MNRDGSGKVTGAGHVQFQTTSLEQRKFGLQPATGHSPVPLNDRTPGTSKSHVVSGSLPDGTAFTCSGVVTEARVAGKDHVRSREGAMVFNLGEMAPEHAAKLKELEERLLFPKFETSGEMGLNCVHGAAEIARHVYGVDVKFHPFETPQGAAARLASEISKVTGRPAVREDVPPSS